MKKIAILFVVEKGYIEQQAILLIKSILKYCLNKNNNIDIFTFSPRKGFHPSQDTIEFLSQTVTHHFTEILNTDFTEFPLINGHIGARFFEKNYPEYNNIVLLDTDTVFLKDFELPSDEEIKEETLYLTPVDNKGVGTDGKSDRNKEFWLKLFKFLSIKEPSKTITTTVGQEKIWPYFNAGFVYSKNIPKFFTQWVDVFETIYKSNIRSLYEGRKGSKSIYLEQVALALTAQTYSDKIKVLPKTINYPIPFYPRLKLRKNALNFTDLVHIHYHKWFQHPGFLDHVTSDEDKQTEQYRWLKEQLPLQPTIDGPFKC